MTKYLTLAEVITPGDELSADQVSFGALVCTSQFQRLHIRFQGDNEGWFYGLRLPYRALSDFPKASGKYNETFTIDTIDVNQPQAIGRFKSPSRPMKLVVSGASKVRNNNGVDHEPGSILQDTAGSIGIRIRDAERVLFLSGPNAYKLGFMHGNVRVKFRTATLIRETP